MREIEKASIIIEDYCRHGDINLFIARHHGNTRKYLEYRKRWEKNDKDELLFLLLETVSSCNFKCPMCGHSAGYDQVPPMSDDIFEIVVRNIKEMGIPSICMNQLNEPLLDKKIFERIKKIEGIDCVLDIHMNTNAALLNKENSLKILRSGITRLLIGFDGFSKETYEKIRVGGDYGKVMQNIMNFLELKEKMHKKLPVVRISFVKTAVNEHEIKKWFKFWKERVDYLSIQRFFTPVLDSARDYLKPRIGRREKIDLTDIICCQPFERAVVRGNGDVLACCAPFAAKMPIGNIRQDSLTEIWHGEPVVNLRKCFREGRWRGHPVCSACLKITMNV